ncbi:MAG: tRNA dihydrouridine synthase [Thermoguttaceae bacterium]
MLRLGSLQLDSAAILAALSGYSDWPMRRICRRLGASYTICEVLLDQFVVDVTKGRKARRFLRVDDADHPAGAQLMGSQPQQFAAAALRLVEAGFDCIDINFGCPVKKVLGRCRGGYLLSDPQTALEIIGRVRDTVPAALPVTVKMRRGMDDSTASRDRFFTIYDGAIALGVAAVTVHGRTVRQGYQGRASWDFLRQLKQYAPQRTLLGSGDLFSAQACLDMLRQTKVDGVAIARGAIGNPWIFQQFHALSQGRPLPPPPALFEQREVIAEHYTLAEELYGAQRCCPLMRKFGIKYSRLHPRPEEVRDAFIRVRNPEDWRDVLESHYHEDLPGRYPDELADEIGCSQDADTAPAKT